MNNLYLNLKAIYFDEIKAGTKPREYRLRNEFWTKRLAGKDFDNLILRSGYPKAGDPDKELILHYDGYEEITLTHPHFGPDPVEVFAIRTAKCQTHF